VPPLWVLHLDIPDGVVAESRDEYYVSFGISELLPAPRGKVSMPIFRQLVAAGSPQVHVGTDLGGNDSRVNVGIYNAGVQTATASVEIHRACDGAVMDSRAVLIPANTIVQTGGMVVGPSTCPSATIQSWARYTVVTVSQPSLTFVSNVN